MEDGVGCHTRALGAASAYTAGRFPHDGEMLVVAFHREQVLALPIVEALAYSPSILYNALLAWDFLDFKRPVSRGQR